VFGLGFTEIIVILVLVLLVFGPARLPEIARGLGKGLREIRRATRELENVPEIRELRRAVDDIRSPIAETLRERVLDPDLPPAPPAADTPPPEREPEPPKPDPETKS
jgi:sec-independent protein translocase protein TatB